MCGSDTFTTVVSSTSMKVPSMTDDGDDPGLDVPVLAVAEAAGQLPDHVSAP